MNKKFAFSIRAVLALIVSVVLTSPAAAGILLIEDFTYPAGSLLTANGWTAHSSAGTNPIQTSAPGLTLPGYPSSGIGNAASLATAGEDAGRSFPIQSAGAVYAAFLVSVSDASLDAAGGYFFHLSPDPVGSTFRSRVFIKKDASNNLAFGISKSTAAAADIAFTPFSYALDTTYLVVVKYTIVDGAGNDAVALFVGPNVPAGEPPPTVSATDAGADINPEKVVLRQGAAGSSPAVRVDGIRVGNSWADVTAAPPLVPAQHVVDFNGDGKTDYAVVRNTGGGAGGQLTWFVNLNGTAANYAAAWGLATDDFVPIDYDGDAKSDLAVWRPGAAGAAAFYILQSQSNTLRVEAFGQTGDDPRVAADYDGDGRADPAVYRDGAASGQQSFWFYRGSLNNPAGLVTYVPWGQTGDAPVPGDYDGDGRHDFVVRRDNGDDQARFWLLQTAAGFDSLVFGIPTDKLAPGDYDGDAKTDLCAVRETGGAYSWFVRPSATGAVSAAPAARFGNPATDLLTPGDYDGDGKTDFAVWRGAADPAQTNFWVLNSATAAVSVVRWGQSGDYPVANYNRF